MSDTSAAELSQFDSSLSTPQPEPGIDMVENCMKQEEVEIGHLSQMDSTNRTPIEQNDEKVARSKKNRRRSKEKRKARLLKFHQKLVKTCGLPSCRLMEQQGPALADVKRSLYGEFEQLSKEDSSPENRDLKHTNTSGPPVHTSAVLPVHVPATPAVIVGHQQQTLVQGNGSSAEFLSTSLGWWVRWWARFGRMV